MTTNAATNALHLQLIAMAQRGERPRCADPITQTCGPAMINATEPSQPCGVPRLCGGPLV
jgi:hypothetical protein